MAVSDGDREYSIDRKRIALAYLAETVIIAASLVGAALFAQQYGHQDNSTMLMMMLAPVAFAVVEFCRVPLAISIRTQTSIALRALAVVGVLGAGCITVKSMSQLGEIMFRPRLYDVVHARERLADAQSAADHVTQGIKVDDALVDQRRSELTASEQQLVVSTEKLGNLPEQKCMPISGVTTVGRVWKSMRCSADQRTAPLIKGVSNATGDRKAASDRLDQARAERASLDPTATDVALRNAKLTYREAVLNSQLHSFAAMVFGKDPTEVTDGEIHQFLRIFVFVPAIGAAFAATLIALMSVQRIKPTQSPIELADDAGHYILGPFAEQIIREASVAASKAATESVLIRPVFHRA